MLNDCRWPNSQRYRQTCGGTHALYTLGNIPDMDKYRSIANQHDIPLIVDAACAIGATYKNMPFGSLADLSVLSFNGNKTITCGGGGAVAGNNEKLLDHVMYFTTTGVRPDGAS